jgi:hypothetical protein
MPGSHFSKNELKTRLKELGLKNINNQDKSYISNLYDSVLSNEKNRQKLIQFLRKDTNNMNLKLTINPRQSMPAFHSFLNNPMQNRYMNISSDVKNLDSFSREQQINLVRPMHTNKGKYAQNPFISGISGQNFYNSYNNEINKKIKYNDNIHSFNYNSNNPSENNEIKIDNANLNNSNNFMNNTYNVNLEKNNLSNISKINNNSSFLSDNNNLFKNNGPKPNEETKIDIYNNINNRSYRNKNNTEEEKINTEQTEDVPHNSYNQNVLEYNESKNLDIDNIETTPDGNDDGNNYKKHSKRLTYQPNSLKNDIYSNNQKNRRTLTNKSHSININEIPYNEVRQNISTISNNNINLSNNEQEENIYVQKKKEPDEVSVYSTFSFFTAFENFKKYPLYKNRKFILIHLLILLAILCIAISLFRAINNSWDSILDFFSGTSSFFGNMLSYIYSLILFPINYWYISIPIVVLIFVFYIIMKKYLFKKRCQEIYERIVKDLSENENDDRRITEDDICRRYSQLYGINYNTFLEKYLPMIRKLRRNDKQNRLKISAENDNYQNYIYWSLNE